jgi:pyruvate formate lyase activating enzyme
VDKKIPWHISRFFPMYKMSGTPITPISSLEKAYKIGKKHLRYVYIGNVLGHKDESTYCYNCRELLIKREGLNVKKINLVDNRCPNCGVRINIIK